MKKNLLLLSLSVILTTGYGQQWAVVHAENACTNRHENALAVVNRNLILLGGRGTKPVESFDLITKRWTQHRRAHLPFLLSGLSIS